MSPSSRSPYEELLRWMHGALVAPGSVDRRELDGIVASGPRLDSLGALAIYQRSYSRRLLGCLREQFPALCHALGEDLFNDFARQYLVAHPPKSHTLYDLGRGLPGYLEGQRPDASKPVELREGWIDFMVDLARFERRLFVMFDAPGHEGRALADPTADDARLRLQSCFELGTFSYPVAPYYHGVRRGEAPEFPKRARSHLALVRRDYITRTVALTAPQHGFLDALARGETIAVALQWVADSCSMPIDSVVRSWAEAGGARERWIEAGFFTVAEG